MDRHLAAGEIVNRDTAHSIGLGLAVLLIGIGLFMAWTPLGPLGIGALILAGIVHARRYGGDSK